ncbi:MAG: peptide chain release factor 1 [Bacillota bacterium]
MQDRLEGMVARHEALAQRLADPELIKDQTEWRRLAKEHAKLEPIARAFSELSRVRNELDGLRDMLRDEEEGLRAMAEEEAERLRERDRVLSEELRVMLLPRDPNDEKNVILEIRAGAGGDEAALFAGELARMYSRFAERKGWRIEPMSLSPTGIGGFKEVIILLEGGGAYSQLKFESGVHRVQRVPETEASGRIHTSTATVAVLPEAEEVEVEVDPNDLRIDVFCASGPGGQSVNTTYSAVRITHLPTGLVVSCQDEKSQHKNRDKAMRVLRARLLNLAQAKQHEEQAAARRLQVGTGDRSERIRTYNFPQNRVTDHRIGLTLHRLTPVLDGDLDELIVPLISSFQAQQLQGSGWASR